MCLRGAPVWPVHATSLTGGTPKSHYLSFWGLSGRIYIYICLLNFQRAKSQKWKGWIRTSESTAELPSSLFELSKSSELSAMHWTIDKVYMVRPREAQVWPVVLGSQPWACSKRIFTFYSPPSLSSIILPGFLLLHPMELPLSSLFHLHTHPHGDLSLDHRRGRIVGGKDSPKAPPLIPHQVCRIRIDFFSQKVSKTFFLPDLSTP